MLIYKRNLKVTQDDFTNKQEEIKNAIRQLVDGYLKNFNEQNFTSTKVDFAIRQAKEHFSTNIDELIGTDDSDDTKKGDLGSNLPDLFDLLREIK